MRGDGAGGGSQFRARSVEILLGNEQVEQVEHEELAVLGRQVVGLNELLVDRRHNAPVSELS